MKLLALVAFFVIFVIALIFSVLNFQPVEINLYFFSFSLPLTVALTIELFAGIAIGYSVALVRITKLKLQNTLLAKKAQKSTSTRP